MKTFETIADLLIIKEHIDQALSNSYEGKSYDRDFEALGHQIMIYTDSEKDVILLSDKLEYSFVLNNHIGSQADIIEKIMNS